MLAAALLKKLCHISGRFRIAARFVVENAQQSPTVVRHAIHAVDDTADRHVRCRRTGGQRQIHRVTLLQLTQLQVLELRVVFEQDAQIHLHHTGFEHRQVGGVETFVHKSGLDVRMQRTGGAVFRRGRQRFEIARRRGAAMFQNDALIDGFGRRMEDGAEQIRLDSVLGRGLRRAEFAHIFVVETQLATQIRVDGRRRQRRMLTDHPPLLVATVESVDQVVRFFHRLGRVQTGVEIYLQSQVTDGQTRIDPQLRHEARHLARRQPFGRTVERHAQMPSALDETIEVVSIDCRAPFGSGEPEGFAQHVGDERIVVRGLRQCVFVDRQHEHVVKVQATRFEYAEHLQSHRRFAVKGHSGLPHNLAYHTAQGRGAHFQTAVGGNEAQAVEQRGHEIEGFGLQHIFKPRGVEAFPFAKLLGLLFYALRQAVEHFDRAKRLTASLKFGKSLLHQRVHLGVGERKTLGDVDLLHLCRKNTQHRLEQILITQHHRRAAMRRFVGRQMAVEPSAHTLRLRRLACGRNHFDLLDVSKIIEAFGR